MKRIFISSIILCLLILPVFCSAQIEDYDDCDDIESAGYPNSAKFCRLMDDITTILYILGIGLAVLIVITSGIQYIVAGGDQAKLDKAKKTLTYGLIGVAIVFASGFLIDLVAEIVLGRLT